MSTENHYLDPVNGIAEAIDYPEEGEQVTLRGSGETVTVARVDRRRHHPIILEDHHFGNVQKRTIVEYSQRVESDDGPELSAWHRLREASENEVQTDR